MRDYVTRIKFNYVNVHWQVSNTIIKHFWVTNNNACFKTEIFN